MWRDAYLEGRVLSADPIELIRILYDHALDLIGEARQELRAGNIAARSRALSRAIAVLAELDGSLNHESGGSISRNLTELYSYMRQKLLQGNLKQEDAPLAEVESLLRTLAEGWNGVPSASAAARSLEPTPTADHSSHMEWLSHTPAELEPSQAAHAWNA